MVGKWWQSTIERLARRKLVNSILYKEHVAPDWQEGDRKWLEAVLRADSGKKLVALLEHSLRGQFEKMTAARSVDDIKFYSGTARGISAVLVMFESLRPQPDSAFAPEAEKMITELSAGRGKERLSEDIPFGRISESIITDG